jgi:hypothetical protein
MRTLALMLSLLALGALGLIDCDGGDDETTAGSETETAGDEVPLSTPPEWAADKKSCGKHDRWRLRVVGPVSCPAAHRVLRGVIHQGPPGSWFCGGPDARIDCTKEPGLVIKARF